MDGLFGSDRVCGVIACETAVKMKTQVRVALRKTRTLELRLDYLRDAGQRAAFLSWLWRERPRAVLIATCRSLRGGGLFGGGVQEQIEILQTAERAGCGWCDVEIETARKIAPRELRRSLAPARVMISHHDFRKTPRNLAGIVRELSRSGGHAVKIAGQCRSIADSVNIC